MEHDWPTDPEEHVWGPWMQKTSGDTRPILQYRMCVHPNCPASEERMAPQA